MGVFLYILITVLLNSFITRLLKNKKTKANSFIFPLILFLGLEVALPDIMIKTKFLVESSTNTVLAALVILIYPFYYMIRWLRLLGRL